MTSFRGLPSPKRSISLPSPCLSLSSHSLHPFMHPLFCFSLASTSTQTSHSLPLGSTPSFWCKRRGSSALRLVLPKSPECPLKHGRRGVAFGCVEVYVNSQVIQPTPFGSVWPWLHSHLLYFIYACYLLSGSGSDVAEPRKCVHKKQPSLPKGCLFTHGVLVDRRGKAIHGTAMLKKNKQKHVVDIIFGCVQRGKAMRFLETRRYSQ